MSAFKQKRVEDPYPSRVTDTPCIIDRLDPIVYEKPNSSSEKEKCPLSNTQLKSYQEDGFLLIESLFSEQEVTFLLDEVERLKTLKYPGNEPLYNAEYAVYEANSDEIRSFFYVHQFNERFKLLSQDRRIVSIAEQLLGSQVYVHQSRINLKPSFKGKEFYWHSDFETWHTEDGMPRMRAVSCSIALTDNNEFNSPLMLIPGSHKFFVSCVGKTPKNHYIDSLRQQQYGLPDQQTMTELVKNHGIASPKGKAGSVVFFECNTIHGSNSNITPYPRTNAFFVYNSIENKLESPYSGMMQRPEHIATRKNMMPIK